VLTREVRILAGRRRHGVGPDRERMDSPVAVELVAASAIGQEDEVAGHVVVQVIRLLADLQSRRAEWVQAAKSIQHHAGLRGAFARPWLGGLGDLPPGPVAADAYARAVRRMDSAVCVERIEAVED